HGGGSPPAGDPRTGHGPPQRAAPGRFLRPQRCPPSSLASGSDRRWQRRGPRRAESVMSQPHLKNIIEAVLMAAGHPMSLDQLQMTLFPEGDPPEKAELKEALGALERDYDGRALELVEVASGYRFQVRQSMEPWVSRLWEE